MLPLPAALLHALEGTEGFDRDAFIDVHRSGEQVTSVRLNPAKVSSDSGTTSSSLPFSTTEKVPWSDSGYYLAQRPVFVFDPLLHAGCYYVQEASGMFIEHAIKQLVDLSQPLCVLDLCGAPGGKSTLLQSILHPASLLVSNEVIRSRTGILEENLVKWGGANVVITGADASAMGALENFFDLIVVDAPCSGSGLFRKDPDAITEWSEEAVHTCSRRQESILAKIFPALKKGGMLVYCTCSYSPDENEQMSDWLLSNFPLQNRRLEVPSQWQIVETVSKEKQAFGYRFWPHRVRGEGFFIACFEREDGAQARLPSGSKGTLSIPNKSAQAVVRNWLKQPGDGFMFQWQQVIIVMHEGLQRELAYLLSTGVYIRRAGVFVGKMAAQELIPDHALALSSIVGGNTVAISLNHQQALQYLRKEEVLIETLHKGWTIAQYAQVNLGWMKILTNRMNNYYPKEWRILKAAQ